MNYKLRESETAKAMRLINEAEEQKALMAEFEAGMKAVSNPKGIKKAA
jgi:hypothetical protein